MVYLKDFSKFALCLCVLAANAWCAPVRAAHLEMNVLAPAPGYSRLLVTLRNPPAGDTYAGLPAAPAAISGVHMAYEAALGNHQYVLKLYTNVSLPQAQAISKALLRDSSVLSASVINAHDRVFYGGVSATSATEAPGAPSFEFYAPRKGGRNAPLVLALTGPGGAGRLAFFLAGYAEQYGAVAAVLALPADETGGAAAPGAAGTRTLAQEITANDRAIAGAVRYIGKLTGAKTDKFYLYGAGAGALTAERYVFQHPQQILQAVFDVVNTGGSPVELAWPDPGQPYPAGINMETLPGANAAQFLKVPMQALLPGSVSATDANSGWVAAMQQLAAADAVANARISSRNVRTDCPAATSSDSATYCMRNGWYAEAIFNGLFGAPPAGSAPIFLTLGPDTRMLLGHTMTMTGAGAGNGWEFFTGNSWTSGDGGALPPGARVMTSKGHAATLQFTPQRAGNYTFRLQGMDISKNPARAMLNVMVAAPSRPPLPAPNPAPGALPGAAPAPGASPVAIAGPALLAPGQAFTLKAVLPAGMDIRRVGCHWRQLSGAAARIVSLPKCQINYVAPDSPGLVNFQLQVTNPRKALVGVTTHLIQVTARASPPGPLQEQRPAPAKTRPPGTRPGLGSLLPGVNNGLPPGRLPGLPPGMGLGPLPAAYPPAATSGLSPVAPPPGYGDLFAPNGKKAAATQKATKG